MSSPPTTTSPKPVSGIGPAIVIILIVAVAVLGYYQMVYYPSAHTEAPTTTTTAQYTPHITNITILPGAGTTTDRSLTYSPNVVTVFIGYNSSVVWTNNDSALHTVTANSSDPDPNFISWSQPSGYNNIQPSGTAGDTLNYTFTIAGTYGYYCKYHPHMIGEIIVKPAPAGLISSTTSSQSSTSATSSSSSILGGMQTYFAVEATTFAKSLATLIGSGIAP